ncbi:MAG: hypothetical protein LAN37_15155 [Acidobacteriia bacterium]|nr:hypothetical protein [Terriglobia bacterium]
MSQKCTDKVVGGILAGWRYDISGLAAEMRGDYEAHFAECAHCRSRQRLHRTIDISLIVIATISAVLFLVAFLAVRHFSPRHALILEIVALGGFAFSTLMWVIVAIATPAPLVMVDAAKTGARRLHDRLPEKVRDRIPEELKQRIS